MKNGIRISACSIIKNEEKNLPAWIEGVKDVADEIVIVDTGSTDNSISLLNNLKKKYNLNLEIKSFEWINDFAAAKNFALDCVTGDFVIFTDADECFIEEDRPKIRPILEKIADDKSIMGLDTPLINIDVDNKNKIYSTSRQIRVFRLDKNLRYLGAVHEHLVYTGEISIKYMEANLTIHHTGYSESLIKKKRERNNKILLKNKNLAKNEPAYYAYTASAYYDEKNYKEAEKNVNKALALMNKDKDSYYLQAIILRLMIKEAIGAGDSEIEHTIYDSLEKLPDHPDILTFKLIREMEKGNFENVKPLAKLIIEKSKDVNLKKRYMNKTDANLPYIRQTLGMLYKYEGKNEEAKEELNEALKSYRYRENILKNLLSLYDEKEQIEILNKYYDKKIDSEFLENALKDFPDLFGKYSISQKIEEKSKNQELKKNKVFDDNIKLSACCIIKNEEKNLPSWLDGVKDIVDEIVVIDTGSTDNSVTLLNTFKNEYNLNLSIYNFKWINDFAAAKNFGLSKLTGDFVIFTDADEYFIESDREKIRPTLAKIKDDASIVALKTPLINIDTDNNNEVISESAQTRILRVMPDLLFSGAVHEHLWYNGEKETKVIEANLTIIHTGYSSKILKNKLKRNKKILLSNENAVKDPGSKNFYLATVAMDDKKFKDAKKYLETAIKYMAKSNDFFLVKCCLSYIETLENLKSSDDKIEKAIDDALKLVPNHPDLLSLKLTRKLENGDFDEVKSLSKVIFETARDKTLRKKYLNSTERVIPNVHYALGAVYMAEGEKDTALKELTEALKSYRYREYILKDIINLLDDDHLIKEFIRTHYNEEIDKEFLSKVLESRVKPKDNLKISACCIIKNEEKNLPAWIDGVKDIADEIVVVDTGSTDNSISLLNIFKKQFNLNLTVYNFKWINDFAAAKNFALSKLTGDWVIFTDADEYIKDADRERIRPLLEKVDDDKTIIGITATMINIDVDNDNLPLSEGTHTRIFRVMDELKYIRPIHEYLWYSGNPPAHFMEADILIYHTGYSSAIIAEKNKRNAKFILEKKNSFDINDPASYTYMAGAYWEEKNAKEAEKYILKAIELMKKQHNIFFIEAYVFLLKLKRSQKTPEEEINAIIEDGIKATNRHPDLLAEKLANIMEDENKSEEVEKIAKEIFQKASDTNLKNKYINHIDTLLPWMHYALGSVYIREHRIEEAKIELTESIKSYRYRKNILNELLNLYEDEKDAAKLIERFYDEKTDAKFLAETFEERPRDALYAYFTKDKTTVSYFLATGDIVNAVKLAAKNLELAKTKDKSLLKDSLLILSISFLFLDINDLPKVEPELNLLPPSAIAVILKFYGENLPKIDGEHASYNAMKNYAFMLPESLRERFLGLEL